MAEDYEELPLKRLVKALGCGEGVDDVFSLYGEILKFDGVSSIVRGRFYEKIVENHEEGGYMGKSFVVSFQKGSLIEGVEAELEPETVLMNCRELVVDAKVFYKNLRKLEREFDDAEMSLRNKSPESFNPNSTKQCRDLIS